MVWKVETRCREYARHKGYEVIEVFRDDITGKLVDRPDMKAMLAWLRSRKRHGEHVVIIDDISRLARGLQAHLDLRSSLQKAGGRLESPSIEFGEDSDSVLVENLLASVAQHQREKNGEQTKNRMRARAQNGFWLWMPPVGYKYDDIKGQGKTLVRNEPLASIVQEGLEGFASGRFASQIEVARFFESHPAFPTDRRGRVFVQRVKEMLKRVLYAGYLTLPKWGLVLLIYRTLRADDQRGRGKPQMVWTATELQDALRQIEALRGEGQDRSDPDLPPPFVDLPDSEWHDEADTSGTRTHLAYVCVYLTQLISLQGLGFAQHLN